MTIAETLIQLRKAAGLSQAELASRADISQAQVSRIELGQHEPHLNTWVRLVRACGQDVSVMPRPPESENLTRLLAACSRLTEKQMASLTHVAEGMDLIDERLLDGLVTMVENARQLQRSSA